jgi:hypothetical protein
MTAFQLGYLVGTLVTPLFVMFVMGTIYYLIKKRRISFRQALLNRWIITASLGLFLLGLVGRATSSRQPDASHVYARREVTEFTRGCVESATVKLDKAKAEKICACAIADIQKAYTYGEFKKLGAELHASKAVPAGLRDILTACSQKPVE